MIEDRKQWPEFADSMQYSHYYNNHRCNDDGWKQLTDRYNDYKNNSLEQQKIPKILHQIWLGEELPEEESKRCEQVKNSLPNDWQYILWTDKHVDCIGEFALKHEFLSTPCLGQRSDLLRLQILNNMGGVYMDTDFETFKTFDSLLDLDFFCGIAYDKEPTLLNSIMASSPGNTFIQSLLQLDRLLKWDDSLDVMDTTGPYFLTRKFFTCMEHNKNIVAFPNSFFYPFPNFTICRSHEAKDYKVYLKKESYCCHLWASTWILNKPNHK